MDNSNDTLKEKTVHADKSEFYVFLPNDLNQIKPNNRAKKSEQFNDAIEAKNEGNIKFQSGQYAAAIETYGEAIEKFENIERLHNLELAAYYQNRAAAMMHIHELGGSISDASTAIELNEHYSKAYYRRAASYNGQKKYFRALQDALQACVLERFRNKAYTDLAGLLLARIDEHPEELQWQMAYCEMDADELYCDHCIRNQFKFINNVGILLLDYYSLTTFEYGKALEVATKALSSFLQKADFKDIFEKRQKILKQIVRHDYWNRL